MVMHCSDHGLPINASQELSPDNEAINYGDIEVVRLTRGDEKEKEWDQFVRSSPFGSPFHLTAWREVIENVFRHRPYYLMVYLRGHLGGVLPLFEVRSPLVRHVLLSVPYVTYGGIVTSLEPARAALLAAAQELGSQLGARYVELRHTQETALDLPTKALYSTFVKPLASDPDVNLEAIPRKQRRMIRQGIKHGLEGRRGWEHLASFYDIFVNTCRRLGSPAYPIQFFEAIREYCDNESQLLTVWHGKRMVAGVCSLFYGDRVLPCYSGALHDASTLAANDFMYWELMREACLSGYQVFDFGRSRQGTGPYNFKRHWGFEPRSLAYQYILFGDGKIPNISPSNPHLQPLIEIWKRLPLPVTKWVGPVLTRWLPA